METIIKSQTPSGKSIEIKLRGTNRHAIDARLSISEANIDSAYIHQTAAGLMMPANTKMQNYKYILIDNTKESGKTIGVAVTDDAAAEITVQYDNFITELNQLPENILSDLIEKREGLVFDINGYYQEAQRAKDRSYESGDGTGMWVFAGKEYEDKAKELKKELSEFDATHSEVISKIKADNEKSALEHMWD